MSKEKIRVSDIKEIKSILEERLNKKQYIGMLQGAIFGDWTLQRGPTNDIEKLKEWKKNMQKCIPNDWNDCKIFEVKELNQNKDEKNN